MACALVSRVAFVAVNGCLAIAGLLLLHGVPPDPRRPRFMGSGRGTPDDAGLPFPPSRPVRENDAGAWLRKLAEKDENLKFPPEKHEKLQ